MKPSSRALPRVFLALTTALTTLGCELPQTKTPAQGPLKLSSISVGFASFEADQALLETNQGFRVFGPGASLAEDAEPEYIAVSADSQTAWVSLQENNGLAQINLTASPSVTWLKGLGLQDFGLDGNAADVQDDDLDVVETHPGLVGFFQPDGISRFTVDGVDYLLLANEGDVREYPGFNEEGRVEKAGDARNVTLNTASFDTDARLALASLSVTRAPFAPEFLNTDLTKVYTFGGRSFSVRRASTGELIWDSGNQLDVQARANNSYADDRSDNKSSEPESVTTGTVGTRLLAFVALERASAVAVYDLADPAAPSFRQWLARSSDTAPEGLLFVSAADSPSGQPLLITSNEKSGTVTVWQAGTDELFTWASTIDLGSIGDAEITAFDPTTRRLFTVCNTEKPYHSRVEVSLLGADLSLSRLTSLSIEPFGYGVNSVAIHKGLVAAAVEGFLKTDPGRVVVWRAKDLKLVATAPTGALPDMVTFTPDGTRILTADEGEPNQDYSVDPVGSVTIIDARPLL